MPFFRGEPSGLRDRKNYIGSLGCGLLTGILVKLSWLPHLEAALLVITLAMLCVVAVIRYRSQSF